MVPLPCRCPLSTEGGMDTAEQRGKGMVFQTHWSELQASICHSVCCGGFGQVTYLLLVFVLPTWKCLWLRIAVSPKNGYVRSWHDAPTQCLVQVHALPSL